MSYAGILVLGRAQYLKEAGLVQLFEWRRDHTVINSEHLRCFTLDEVAQELRGHYETLVDVSARGLE